MSHKKFGLALGSGSWRGLAHIGVLKSLTQNDIPIDYISGSSIGAIVGGLYAALGDVNEIEKITHSLSFRTVLKTLFPRPTRHLTTFDNHFDQFFKKIVGDVQIEDLKIPFSAVVSNLLTGELTVLDHGSLITAMKASSAIPLFFKPVKIGDDYFFDGGMISPVPVQTVRKMGADVVLGVSLYGGIFPINLKKKRRLTRIRAGELSRFLSLKKLSDIDLSCADIPLELKIPHDDYSFFARFSNNREAIESGLLSTETVISQIKQKLNF
jgi:NTE family protein